MMYNISTMANTVAIRKIMAPINEKPDIGISIPLLDCKTRDDPTISAEIMSAIETRLTILSSLFENLSSSSISSSIPISPFLALRSA